MKIRLVKRLARIQEKMSTGLITIHHNSARRKQSGEMKSIELFSGELIKENAGI